MFLNKEMSIEDSTEELQFDETDLVFDQEMVSEQRRLEKVEEILEEILKKDGMPKEDLRKNWNAKKTEREKLLKQRRKAKEQVTYWVSKLKMYNIQINRNSEDLERMRGMMLADCMND